MCIVLSNTILLSYGLLCCYYDNLTVREGLKRECPLISDACWQADALYALK